MEKGNSLFIDKIVANELVWILASEEGIAASDSEKDEDVEVVPFWSEEALAQAVAQDDWAQYAPQSITLAEFLEDWLAGMHNDEALAGIDWDTDMLGQETEPLILALEIINKLSTTGKELSFENYESLADFKQQIKEATGLA